MMVLLNSLIDFLLSRNHRLLQQGTVSKQTEIHGPRDSNLATGNNFTFFNGKAGDQTYTSISNSNAALLIIDNELDIEKLRYSQFPYVFTSDNAKKTMLELSTLFFTKMETVTISTLAHIHPMATIGSNCAIHPFVVIEEDVVIGDNCIIEPSVHIKNSCRIGNNVIIKSGSVLGGNGFGYVMQDDGKYAHVPHFGSVIIEDDVHIGSNTCIDKGSFSDTIIRKGVRIDNLVHIAHNVEIGENTLIIANSMIAGSVKIGANSWIAPSASIKNGISIGKSVTVGLSSLVLKSVPDNDIVAGVPAKSIKKIDR